MRIATEAKLQHNSKTYRVVLDWKSRETDFDEAEELARYMWMEGNYACDCNKSSFIQHQVDQNFPDFDCGDRIQLKELAIRGYDE